MCNSREVRRIEATLRSVFLEKLNVIHHFDASRVAECEHCRSIEAPVHCA